MFQRGPVNAAILHAPSIDFLKTMFEFGPDGEDLTDIELLELVSVNRSMRALCLSLFFGTWGGD